MTFLEHSDSLDGYYLAIKADGSTVATEGMTSAVLIKFSLDQ